MRDRRSPGDDCPKPEQLLQLLENSLADAERLELESHLGNCPGCQVALDQLATDPEEWPRLIDALRQPVPQTATGAQADTVIAPPPTAAWQLDGYEILEEIGRGGAGTIHRAIDLQLRRQVAVKMLQSASLEHAVRFRNEAAAAAQLQHPNIIEVFATGIHENRAYLVMELIRDGDLGRYLSGRPLESREAAQLVATLAKAIQVAHAAGILHRDLKPANILLQRAEADDSRLESLKGDRSRDAAVTAGEASASACRPKITDFGLAFWTEVENGPTQTGEFLGTPSYMSPEQALAHPGWATPRVDIYALGAILYECLAGHPPFQADSTAGIVDLLLHTEPVAPRRLNPSIPRDLETICLKCLEKQPERRYQSAGQLADDLDRFLDGETISARPTPPWERALRWSRRNVTSSILLGVLLISIVALLGVWGRFTQRLRAETQRAVANAAETQRTLEEVQESNEATQEILEFITEDFFDAATPERSGIDLTVVQVLEQIDSRLAERFEGRPKSEAPMRVVVGNLWRRLGQPQRAVDHLARGVQLYEQAGGPRNDGNVFDAKCSYFFCLMDLNRVEEARPVANELIGWEEGITPRQRLTARKIYGSLLFREEGAKAAVPYLTELHADCVRILGEYDTSTLSALGSLGVAYERAGQPDVAMKLFRQQLEALTESVGPDDVATLGAAHNFAYSLVQRGEYDEAEKIHRDTLERKIRIQGRRHRDTIASHRSLVMLYWRQGRRADAVDGMEDVVDDEAAVLGADDRHTIATMHQLSEMYMRTREFERAANFLGKHLEPIMDRQLLTTDFEWLLVNYGKLLLSSGEPAEAERVVKRVTQLLDESQHSMPRRKLEQLQKMLSEHEATESEAS